VITFGGLAATTALALTGCAPSVGGSGGGSTKAVSKADIDKAMNTATTITFWTWVPDIQKEIDLFEKAYPKIKVKLVNTTGGAQHYPKLRSALKAGKGIPDVAQMEYQNISSFTQTKSLANLAPYGAADEASTSTGCGSRSRTTTASGASRRTPAPSGRSTARTSSTRRG
jgi:multiple sugar transport system substrate-binding protein